ncbi:flagellar hook-basal body complex protein FliE [Spongiibacter sp. IMCC21906]|jgi:flagellar hook-basal body complex protein FliE|uniref:flagellar hook-basal body complex protein FliE n=1 Tax=Spongiibacter sp. IMCC21906 TaxID=1620392 RepID=UPI00062DCF57|nr:flagellar hook-basal body complex protein FliE [Spongiibacter sp. IMCC21906]AKH69408.1 flagellar hook-basal body complex protein FliE [Spongiibacter sp. IMCC21906]
MSDSMSVNQLLGQIRSIREQTSMAPPKFNESGLDVKGLDGRLDVKGLGVGGLGVNGVERAGFSQLLSQSIDAVNQTQKNAGALAAAYERGADDVSLTEVMVNLQKADVSFKALVEVRNKFVDAYQEVMRMSV